MKNVNQLVAMAMIIIMMVSTLFASGCAGNKGQGTAYMPPPAPTHSYAVTKPFELNGKHIGSDEELAAALKNRPSRAIVRVTGGAASASIIGDMADAGYVVASKEETGKGKDKATEITFKKDPESEKAYNQQMQQYQQAQAQREAEANKGMTTGETWAVVGGVIGIAAAIGGAVMAFRR